MMKVLLGKLKRKCPDFSVHQGRDRLFLCFVLLLAGIVFGSMAAGEIFYDYRINCRELFRAAFEFLCCACLWLLSTSYLGIILIPVFICLKGFISAAFISSFHVYSGLSFGRMVLLEAIPFFVMLPVFLLLANYGLANSSRLLYMRFGIGDPAMYRKGSTYLFLLPVLVVFEIIYCIYIIPYAAS